MVDNLENNPHPHKDEDPEDASRDAPDSSDHGNIGGEGGATNPSPNTGSAENSPNRAANPSSRRPQLTPEQMKIQQQLENELGLARFLDYVVNEPFELIFQEPIINKYEKQLIEPLFGAQSDGNEFDGRHVSLKDDFNQLNIRVKFKGIISTAEEIAKKHNITKPYLVKAKNLSLGIISAVFILFFILMAIDKTGTVQSLYLPIAILLCFFPKYIQKIILKKWEGIKKELNEELRAQKKDDLDDIKIFIQYILDDVRERLLEYHIPLQAINFMVLSGDYDHVKIVTTQEARGIKHYVLQFEYPKGMQPFEIPKNIEASLSSDLHHVDQSGAMAQPEHEEDNDEFIILKNQVFDEDGKLKEFDVYYPTGVDIEGIEHILNQSEFQTVPAPEVVIPFFYNNDRVKCDCGAKLVFKNLKSCKTKIGEKDFEYYLIIAEKCKCGQSPFVLMTSPGNEKTPDEVIDLFGEIKEA